MSKKLLAVVTMIAGLAGLSSCGSGTEHSRSTTTTAGATTTATNTTPAADIAPAPVHAKADADQDADGPGPEEDTNNDSVLHWAQPASHSEALAVTTLLRRYYAAAVAEDGARGCALLYSTFAEALPEDYGLSPPGQPYMKGTTCQAVLSGTFKHFHPLFSLEAPRMHVIAVRLQQHHGIAVMSFGSMPERQIPIAREGRAWRVQSMADGLLS